MSQYAEAIRSNLCLWAAGRASTKGLGSEFERAAGISSTLLLLATLGLMPTVSAAQQSREKVLHSFNEDSNGDEPFGSVILVDGSLYGTTLYYDGNEPGVVFKLSAAGAETVLHTFGGVNDGANRRGNLLNVNGTL